MKLTAEQIFFLQEACTLRAVQLMEHSSMPNTAQSSLAYWKAEAAKAHELSLILKDALGVEIESVHLDSRKDACGDINCDGQCTPAPEPVAEKPQLIHLIDNCTEEHEARAELQNASLRQRRRAAAYLGVPYCDLLPATLGRVRARLHPAA